MQPTSAITRLDLGMTAEEFNLAADRAGFIAPRVFRVFQTPLNASQFPKRTLEQLLKLHDTKRAPRAGYNSDEGEFGTDSYATEDHGLEGKLDDREVAIYRDVFDAELATVNATVDGVLRRFEYDAAAATYDTAIWTGSSLATAITNEWDDHTNATPITDVNAAREKIVHGTGIEPNALIMNRFQMRHARECPEITDKIKYVMGTLPKEITPAILAQAFDLDFVLVAGGMKNTANEAQSRSISRLWSNEYMMLAKVALTDSLEEPAVGRTFVWDGNGGAGPGSDTELAYLVEEYRNPNETGTIYRCRNDRGIKRLYPALGHLLSNAIT